MHIIIRLGGLGGLATLRLGALAALTALVTGVCMPALAAPGGDANSGQHQAKTRASALSGCDNIPSSPHRRGGDATQSRGHGDHLRQSDNDCRLTNANGDIGQHINDGASVDQAISMFDDTSLDKQQAGPEQPLDPSGNDTPLSHIELSDTDHKVHVYMGDGMNRQDLGPVSALDAQQEQPLPGADGRYAGFDPAEHSHRLVMGSNGDTGHLSGAANAAGNAALMAAIPEPDTYAMLLAGLALVLLVRRRDKDA